MILPRRWGRLFIQNRKNDHVRCVLSGERPQQQAASVYLDSHDVVILGEDVEEKKVTGRGPPKQKPLSPRLIKRYVNERSINEKRQLPALARTRGI